MIELLQSVAEWVKTAHSEVVQDYIKGLIHEQAVNVDYEFYESPEYLDLLEQIRSESGSRPVQLLENLGNLLQSSITLVAMAAMLMSYNPWLPLVLLLSKFLPAFFVVLRFDRSYHQWWKSVTQDRRWAQYYDVILTHSDSAAEVRLFELGRHFQLSYQRLRSRMRSERFAADAKAYFLQNRRRRDRAFGVWSGDRLDGLARDAWVGHIGRYRAFLSGL
ncbi:MAG: hypothetical protein WKF84_20555 [Pyrinomonadaceae bacterium]